MRILSICLAAHMHGYTAQHNTTLILILVCFISDPLMYRQAGMLTGMSSQSILQWKMFLSLFVILPAALGREKIKPWHKLNEEYGTSCNWSVIIVCLDC